MGSRSKVSEVLNGKRRLSLTMIRALHKRLGIPAEVLLEQGGASGPDAMANLQCERFPLGEMVKRGWISSVEEPLTDLKGRAEELVRLFLQQIDESRDPPSLLRLRQHVRSGAAMDSYALLAWCIRVVTLAQEQPVAKYEQGGISPEFMRQLTGLSYMDSGPRLAQEFLAKSGIHLVVLRHLPRTHLDGASIMLSSVKPIIALTLRYDRLDNFWFTLCHELGHVAKHFEQENGACFVDDLDADGDRLEDQADEFARDSLIPPEIWQQAQVRTEQTPFAVRTLAASLKVHPAIIAGRIRQERKNYRLLSRLVGQRTVRRLFPGAAKGWIG
jgi:HTH-type transcriptional regulator/antitoxin HigA